jgi:hypothetical protein
VSEQVCPSHQDRQRSERGRDEDHPLGVAFNNCKRRERRWRLGGLHHMGQRGVLRSGSGNSWKIRKRHGSDGVGLSGGPWHVPAQRLDGQVLRALAVGAGYRF